MVFPLKAGSKSKLENAWIGRTRDRTEVSCSVIRRNRGVAGVVRDVEGFARNCRLTFSPTGNVLYNAVLPVNSAGPRMLPFEAVP
jgi:hypothetical protein